MKILTRYLLRAHVGPFFFAFAALTGVITINTLARRLAELAGKGLPLEVVFRFFVLSLPATIALTFPMAVLVSVLYTFSQLTADNEVTALKASGIDLKRLLLPLFLAAALIAGGMVWFNDRVLPESNHRWSQLMIDIGRKSPLFVLREQTLNRIPTSDGRSFYLRAARIDPTTNRLRDVVIYDVGQPRVSRTIYADSGIMAFNTARTDLLLTLFDGHLREVDMDQPESFQRVEFDQQMRRLPGVANQLQIGQSASGYRGDREMTVGMMQARIDTLNRQVREVRRDAHRAAGEDLARVLGKGPAPDVGEAPVVGMTSELGEASAARQAADQLSSSHARVRELQRQVREFRVEIHKKYSIAAATLVFVLVGAPLAIRFPRGGVGMVIAFSLLIFAVYYVGLIGGETLADEGYVTPLWAMWIVNAVMAGLGLLWVARMGSEASTARGGAWDERIERIRAWGEGLWTRGVG
ncbi:MAG TPA: LptF/LptG family permease [Longimicrobiaceae bacterium]|nr:LptF/LptG family permease [Longimicrobiaceae bacterium]